MHKCYNQLLTGCFLLFFIFHTTLKASAQINVTPAHDNFTSFTPDKNYTDAEKLTEVTPAAFRNHPDYGKCFTDNTNWYEQIDKRTLKSRRYIGDEGQVMVQYGYDNLNYVDNNGWMCAVDTKLKPAENGWAVKQQENPAYLYTDASTSLSIGNGQLITFNKNVQFNSAAINTMTKTVGDNGMMIKNVVPNTDKIIRFKRNTVETDYLINKPLNISGDLIISEDIILPAGYSISQDAQPVDANEAGSLAVVGPDGKVKAVLKVPACYDRGKSEIIGSYRIQKQTGGYRLEIDVPSSWINSSSRQYPITIDPVITGTTSEWTGGKIASCIFPNFGSGSMDVTVPADITITGFYVQASYYANPVDSEPLDDGLVYFGTKCGSTGLSSISPPSGDSSGTGIIPLTDYHASLSCCIYPSCSPQNIDLTMYLSRLAGGSLCDSQYIYYDPANTGGSPFEAYIVGNTIQLNNSQWGVSPTTTCGNDCNLTFTATVNYGVPPYTISHAWADSSVTTGKYDTSICTSTASFTINLTIPNCPITSCTSTLLSVPPPTITDACGTAVSGLTFKFITIKPVPVVTASSDSMKVCSGDPFDVSLTSCVSGTTFTWTGSDGSSGTGSPIVDSVKNTSVTAKTVTYTITPSSGGCTGKTVTIPVIVEPIPTSSFTVTPSTICANGKLVVAYSGASYVGAVYNWNFDGATLLSGSATGPGPDTISFNSSGSYTISLSVTVNGCTSVVTTENITIKPNPVIVVTPNPATICSGTSTTLSATGANTYIWSPATGLSSTSGSSVSVNTTSTTVYSVTGTGSNGCVTTVTDSVKVNVNPVITATPSPSSYCPGGSSALTASGGKTYTWSPSTGLSVTTGSSVTASPIVTTTYTVTGINSNGCSNTAIVVVTVDVNPVITATPNPSSYCPGGSSTLTASGGVTYTWSPSTALSATTGSSVTANPTITTTYTVTGTNSNGCSATATLVVTVNPNPVITATPNPASYCLGGSSTLTASGGSTYTWSPSTGLSPTTGSSVTANPTATTTYTVTATSSSGCSATATVVVTVNPNPVITATPNPASYCSGGSCILTASGGSTYTWSPSTALSATTGSSVSASPTITTTYTVTGTNSSGCSATATVVVTVNPNPVITATPNPASYCPGGSSTLTASGGTTYTWSPSTGLNPTTGSSVTANPTAITTYTVMGTNSNGCSATATVVVTVNPTPVITATPSPASYCPGGSSTLTASGGNTYTWSPATALSATTGSSVTANPTVTTTYTVTGTSSKGCSAIATVIVTVNLKPVINITPNPATICKGTSTTLSATGANTYTWSPATGLSSTTGSSVSVSDTLTTVYSVTGTVSTGCVATVTDTVKVNPYPVINATPSPASYCPGGSSILTASGGSTYTWSPSNALSVTTGSSVTANPTITTTYTVTGTSSKGCTATATVVVTVNPIPVITATPSPASYCPGGNSILTASGGTTYTWSPSTGLSPTTGSSVTASPTITTTYTVTGTNSNGCSNTTTVVVTVNTIPVITVTPSPASYCPGGSSTLTASGGTTYTWSPSIGLSPTTGSSVTANPTTTTTYTVTGTNSNGCSATATVVVTVNPTPSITATPSPASYCPGGSSTLTASGSTTYTWSPSTALSATTGSSVTASPTVTTTYTVTGTSSQGCSATTTVVVTVNLKPIVNVIPNPATICSGTTTTLSATGATTYTWSPATGLSSTTGSSVSVSDTSTTVYTVTGTVSTGCATTVTDTVKVNANPVINATPNPSSYCPGGSSVLTASGGKTYTWSPSTGLSPTTGSSVTATTTITTTYIVTGTNSNGCSNTAMVVVTVNPSPVVNVSPNAPSYCPGGSSTLTATGGDTYIWSPSTALSATTGSMISANPTTTTTYTVTGTSSQGCSAADTIVVTVNPNPVITVTPNPETICSGVSATLSATGASTYTWSPATALSSTSGSSVSVSDTVTTVYTITGTSSAGCIAFVTDTVKVDPNPVITAKVSQPIICSDSSTVLTASGGINYIWYPATGLSGTDGASVIASPSVTTTYSVTGSNDDGCLAEAIVTVTVAKPIITIVPVSPAYCIGDSTTLMASGINNYTWSPSAGLNSSSGTSVIANPTITSTYTVSGTDSMGCFATTTFTVTVDPNPKGSVTPDSAAICAGTGTKLTTSGASYYFWFPATGLSTSMGSSVVATPTIATTYTVIAVDSNGCKDTSKVGISVNPLPTITAAASTAKICFKDSVNLTSGGGKTYTWSPSSGLSTTSGSSIIAIPDTTTRYLVTGIDSGGCSDTASVLVTIIPGQKLTISPPDTELCMGSSVTLVVSGAQTYSWSPSIGLNCTTCSSVIATPTVTSTYIVSSTNTLCPGYDSVTIKVDTLPTLSISKDTLLCQLEPVQLNATTGGAISWSPSTGLSCTTCDNPVANPDATTTYIASSKNGACSVSDSVTISITIFNFTVGPDQHIIYGEIAQLTASGAVHYSWTPSISLNNDTIKDPVADPTVTTTYYVTGTDSLGCSTIDTVIVFVGSPCQLIHIPSAFTPDGKENDYFHILSSGDVTLSYFKIYNRWGQVVYQTDDINDRGWDGTYNGKTQPIGNYVYEAGVVCEGRTILLHGSVLLIR